MDGRFLAYLAVITLLIVIPGPDMLMVTRTVLRSGRRAASLVSIGIGAGSVLWACASAVGIAVLLERSVIAFTVLKIAGGLYLAFLGLRSLLAHGPARSASGPAVPVPVGTRAALAQGIATNLLNPKAGVIFATVVPQFIRPGDPIVRLAAMLLAFEIILLVWLHVYAAAVGGAGRSRAGTSLRRAFERIAGAVLLGLGIRLAFERR
ncbi:MAG TPA: LysE family translocator [Candidatus Limnocylindrales bacterium]|nr:LysE family translocator [Candidatus Limnocylindrales bacterium]